MDYKNMKLRMTGFSKEDFDVLSNKIIEDSERANVKFLIFNKEIWEKCVDAVISELKEIDKKKKK